VFRRVELARSHFVRGAITPTRTPGFLVFSARTGLIGETVHNLGVLRIGLVAGDQESGMKWRVVVELAGADGTVPVR
jgi:hypothetical protein